jgi:hypothetical protein
MALTPAEDWQRNIDKHIRQIAKEMLRGRIGFLFGAGMSIPSGGLPGSTLALELVKAGHFSEPLDPSEEQQMQDAASRYPLEAIAAGVAPNLTFQEAGLVELLKKTAFGGKDPDIHPGHKDLAAILKRIGSVRMLFTTNWDLLLKKAIGESAEVITPTNEKKYIFRLSEMLAEKVAIVHLHGTFDDEPLIREQDLMSPDGPLFQIFLGELMTKSFVFVGYSLSDPNIRALYYKVGDILTTRHEKLQKTTYIVFPARNHVDRIVSMETWKARNATYVPLGADEFFRRLHRELETAATDELKEELRKRLGLSDVAEINNKIDEIIAVFPDFTTPHAALLYLYSITKR